MTTFFRVLLVSSILHISIIASAFGQVKNTEHTVRLADGAKSPAATADDFAFLTGYWVGEGFGGTCEEMWSQPMASTMLCTFRLISDNALNFSEIVLLTFGEEGTSIRLKHFDPEMKSWEEKDDFLEFKLVKVEKNAAWFEGLTYKLADDGKLYVHVAMKKKDGTFREGSVVFERRALPPH